MRILGLEIRRTPKEEPFDVRISYPIGFSNDRYIRIIPKNGYEIIKCDDIYNTFWIKDTKYHELLNKSIDELIVSPK